MDAKEINKLLSIPPRADEALCEGCLRQTVTLVAGRCACGNDKNSVYLICYWCAREQGKCAMCGAPLL